MIHGPCGAMNMNSPCMRNRKCSKGYPKEFIEETQTSQNGYPRYKRRSQAAGGHTVVVKVKSENKYIRYGNR